MDRHIGFVYDENLNLVHVIRFDDGSFGIKKAGRLLATLSANDAFNLGTLLCQHSITKENQHGG